MVSKAVMMSRTGSKRVGFTLIEVMIAVAVLSLGAVFLFEAFFVSLNATHYCRRYFTVAPSLDEKVWGAQDSLSRLGPAAQVISTVGLERDDRAIEMGLSYSLLAANQNLYAIDAVLSWQEGRRRVRLTRSAYALYVEKK